MSFILLEQQRISFEDIINAANETHFSIYSKEVLAFCSKWLGNQKKFEITTSGTTGNPKKILLTRELMLWSINNTASALHLTKDMLCLHCIDAKKAGGKMMLARALHLGMSMEIVEPGANPFKNSNSKQFDFAAMVPLQIHHLYKENKIDELNKVDTLIIGGAPLNASLINALQSVKTKVYATYGMTETASHIALQRMNGMEKQSAFVPLPGVTITANENNCAVISTPFHSNLVTNDIIKLEENDTFEITGRFDNIINSGGVKISLEKIETVLDKALTSLKINFYNYCVYKQPDERLGDALIVIFETATIEKQILDELIKELKHHLDKHELPKHFYFTNKLEYTSSGKIDRKKSAEKALFELGIRN